MMTSDHRVKQILTDVKEEGTWETEEDLYEHYLLPTEMKTHVELYLHDEFKDQPEKEDWCHADLDDVAWVGQRVPDAGSVAAGW